MSTAYEPRIYVASLSDYNSGVLHGAWIDLDGKDADNVNKEINTMLKGSHYPNVMRRDCVCECGHEWTEDVYSNALPECPICDKEVVCSAPYPSAEEYAIHDFDGFGSYKVEEYSSIAEMVKVAEAIIEHDDNAEAFLMFLSDRGDLDDAIERFEEAFQGEYDSEKEFAEQLVDDLGYLKEMPEQLRYYFDYDAFARDIFINDYSSERLENGNVAVFNRNV